MVEVKLDLCEEMYAGGDCFVAVRVGDYQKLSRLAPSRTYRFPQAIDKAYGKIEVFKRVGATSINIDPLANEVRKVGVPIGDEAIPNLSFKVAIDADDGTKKKLRKEKEHDETSAKAAAAKDYLAAHCLEVRLSDAMQALLRERPENPAEFLSEKLIGSKFMVSTVLPPIEQAKPKEAEGVAAPEMELPKEAPPELPPSMKSAPPPIPQDSASWSPSKGPYQEMAPESFEPIYSKFQSKEPKSAAAPAAAPAAPAEAAPAASKANYKFNPSVGTWHMKRPTRMPAAPAPAAATASAAAPARNLQVSEIIDHRMKPSVGTWFMKLPKKMSDAAAEVAPKAAESKAAAPADSAPAAAPKAESKAAAPADSAPAAAPKVVMDMGMMYANHNYHGQLRLF